MYQKLMHNKSLRLIGGLLGGLLLSVAINVFIVPQGLYGGGAYGLCQVIRTLLQRELSLSLPFDLAGVLYFFVNIPLFLLAYKALGREFSGRRRSAPSATLSFWRSSPRRPHRSFRTSSPAVWWAASWRALLPAWC